MRRKLSTILFVIVFLAGLSLLLYPTVSDYWNSFHQSRAIASYVDAVDNTDEQKLEEMRQAAEAYNEKLLSKQDRYDMSDSDRAEYESLLDVSGTGVMGYVEIPSINVLLPIYHGTDNTILQIGVGHIEGTSLPVGGASTHCAVSGHRGLTSSKLFTDIDQMVEGDTFKLYVLGETLTYEVDQIRIVLPDELNDLKIEEGQDYCTLITCTPYGVNSHRLLIRGHRIANDAQGLIVEDVKQVQPLHEAIVLGILFLVLYIIICKILSKTILYRFRKEEKCTIV
jgi:sortase A